MFMKKRKKKKKDKQFYKYQELLTLNNIQIWQDQIANLYAC